MSLLGRFRLWCARPFIALAQVKFDLDVAALNFQIAQAIAQAKLDHFHAYRDGYAQGAKDMESYCADAQAEPLEAQRRLVH